MNEIERMTRVLDRIERRYPKRGKRISTIVENPYEAGYMPIPKIPKSVLAKGRRLLKLEAQAKKPAKK